MIDRGSIEMRLEKFVFLFLKLISWKLEFAGTSRVKIKWN